MAAAGGIVGGITSAANAIGSTIASFKMQREQQDFIKKQRRTAYQDTMDDMRAAGLNPILAYRQGPTTVGPGGSTQTPRFDIDVARGIAAGAAGTQAKSAAGLREAQITSEARRQNMLNAQAAQGYSAANLNDRQAEIISNRLPAARTEREFDESGTGKSAIKVRRALLGGSSAAGAAARLIGR